MTRTHAVLWALILASTVADVLLTLSGLAAGYREGNVVVAALISAFGVAGLWLVKFAAMLWLVKFAAMLWLVGGWTLLSDRDAAAFLALFAAVTVAVAGYNAVLLFG